MKRAISAALLLILAIVLASCSGKRGEIPVEELVVSELTGEITVSCYDTARYQWLLNEAAPLFELEHPGTKINIELFSQVAGNWDAEDYEKEEQTVRDYILRINTQLMSGKGPDILAMDVLPYYKYAASGMLEDLRAYMDADPDINRDDYRYNIFEGVRYKGGQYIMPLNFYYTHLITFDKNKVGDEAATKLQAKNTFSYTELMGLIEERFAADDSDARVIDFSDRAFQAFITIFRIDYKKYVDLENKKATFTDGSFAKLLNDLHEQELKGYYKPKFSSMEERIEDLVNNQALYYYRLSSDYTLKQIFTPEESRSPNLTTLVPDIDEIAGLLANDAGQVDFGILQAFGINAYSHNKALAWAFIKFMLGEEMQQSINLLGYPVHNAAFIEDSKVDMLKTVTGYVEMNSGGWRVEGYEESTDEKLVQAYEDFMEYHNGFVNALSFYPLTDQIITLMVYNEVELFFDGAKSAEMVADTLQNKIWLYLNE
jgi:ABC-type glycerol-3-phosphate transport system substrate-binding protein